MTNDELLGIKKQMKLCTDNEIDIIKRIHEWGSRSVHQGQILPTSILWYCLFFVEYQLKSRTTPNGLPKYFNEEK
jgi:hypothetical protein